MILMILGFYETPIEGYLSVEGGMGWGGVGKGKYVYVYEPLLKSLCKLPPRTNVWKSNSKQCIFKTNHCFRDGSDGNAFWTPLFHYFSLLSPLSWVPGGGMWASYKAGAHVSSRCYLHTGEHDFCARHRPSYGQNVVAPLHSVGEEPRYFCVAFDGSLQGSQL